MNQLKQNKQFIIEYINATSGQIKTRALLEKYNSDPGLIENILFKESIFPKYEVSIQQIIAENNTVVVLAKFKGIHQGEGLGIAPTHKEVNYTFAVGYEVTDRKITKSWVIVDNLAIVEQLKQSPDKN